MIRVVLAANVLVSALLFDAGRLSWMRQAWQGERIKPLLAAATSRELSRVLAYPMFRLSTADLETLLTERLPWCDPRAGALEA
jgi:predicted nucleic acid-binding protein